MRTPQIYQQEKRWQIAFWTSDNKRKQKSVGAGAEGRKLAELLKKLS
ncbi:MAG: hypothetical protein IKN65_01925 [Clostridia bacterium]|nr:hypothetical protein [Clostridia bacterium]